MRSMALREWGKMMGLLSFPRRLLKAGTLCIAIAVCACVPSKMHEIGLGRISEDDQQAIHKMVLDLEFSEVLKSYKHADKVCDVYSKTPKKGGRMLIQICRSGSPSIAGLYFEERNVVWSEEATTVYESLRKLLSERFPAMEVRS